MLAESPRHRARRKFVFGVLEQASNILGGMAASVTVVGMVVPAIAIFTGTSKLTRDMFIEVAMLVIGFAFAVAVAAVVLRGLARRLEDYDNAPSSDGAP